MGEGRGFIRAVKTGVFVAGLMLALSVPVAAFAANTATFSSVNPKPGSSSTILRPHLVVTVYDRYGVTGTHYWMKLDGVKVPVRLWRFPGTGYRKFKLGYYVPSDLSLGVHVVTVRVTDRRSRTSTYSWSFTVIDGTPPVTTSDAALNYPAGSATIHLNAVDNVGVTHTYYRLDGGAQVEGTVVNVPGSDLLPLHSLEFWSVDAAGNAEAHHMWTFFVPAGPDPPAVPFVHPQNAVEACNVTGCHGGLNIAAIHTGLSTGGCVVCHSNDVAATGNCITCHTATPAGHTAETHASILSGGDPSCSQATCHGTAVVTIHNSQCALCHDSASPLVNAVVAAGDATCEDCHTASFEAIHVAGDAAHVLAPSACFNALCHPSDAADVHTQWTAPPGCVACHAPAVTPSTTCTDCHDPHATETVAHAATIAAPCAECHGSSLADEHSQYGITCLDCHASMDTRVEFAMTRHLNECDVCHNDHPGGPNANPFLGPNHGTDFFQPNNASVHNVLGLPVGMKSKFDGSQGPVLTWSSEIASASLAATWLVEAGFPPAIRPEGITSVSIGQTGTVTTTWEIPTVNVFWQPGDPTAPAGAMFLNSNSVIRCDDCHDGVAGIQASGPHGSTQSWAMDPNFASDYSYAELTKQIVDTDGVTPKYSSGIKLRSTLTTATQTYTSGMTVICSKCHDLQNYQSGTTVNNPLPYISTGDDTFVHDGDTYDPILLDQSGTRNDGYFVWTDSAGDMVPLSAITTTGTPGSQTWTSTNPQAQPWMQGATGTVTASTVGSSNTAHSSHHQDATDGSAQCVNCHVGVTHGWKTPRLLVNGGWDGSANSIGAGVITADVAPYRDPAMLGSTRTNGGILMVNGFNHMGMLTLSAVDSHPLTAGSPNAAPYNTGAAMWSEPSCQACNDHAGEDGIRIIDSPNYVNGTWEPQPGPSSLEGE